METITISKEKLDAILNAVTSIECGDCPIQAKCEDDTLYCTCQDFWYHFLTNT